MTARIEYEVLPNAFVSGITVPNREKFRLACCGCGLVHDVVINADGIKKGRPLGLAMKRNGTATRSRRSQLKAKRSQSANNKVRSR